VRVAEDHRIDQAEDHRVADHRSHRAEDRRAEDHRAEDHRSHRAEDRRAEDHRSHRAEDRQAEDHRIDQAEGHLAVHRSHQAADHLGQGKLDRRETPEVRPSFHRADQPDPNVALAPEPRARAGEVAEWGPRQVKEERRRASFPSTEVATPVVQQLVPTATLLVDAAPQVRALPLRVAARSS
jgi:hypothetical protein